MIDKKQQMIETAYTLFAQNGFHATGVDLIMKEAKVSKRTLYKYFPSKDALIAAVLEYYRSKTMDNLRRTLDDSPRSAAEKILLMFDIQHEVFCDPKFSGCIALNAMAEFAGKCPEIEAVYLSFKQDMEQLIMELCIQAGVKDAKRITRMIAMLLDGAISFAHMHKDPTIAEDAKIIVAAELA